MIAGQDHVQNSRSARVYTLRYHCPTTSELQGFIIITRPSRWPCIQRATSVSKATTHHIESKTSKHRHHAASRSFITVHPLLIPLSSHCAPAVLPLWHSCHPTLPRRPILQRNLHHVSYSRPQSRLYHLAIISWGERMTQPTFIASRVSEVWTRPPACYLARSSRSRACGSPGGKCLRCPRQDALLKTDGFRGANGGK